LIDTQQSVIWFAGSNCPAPS